MRRIPFAMALLLVGCRDDPEQCFDPTQSLEIPGGLAGERWRTGDVDGDGREDLIGIEEIGPGVWRLHPLLGRVGDSPFEVATTVDIDADVALEGAITELLDANADGVLDLAVLVQGRVVLIDGPLLQAPTPRAYPVSNLAAGRGAFIDFDDDGIIDLVMRDGTGDNLRSLRGLPEGGFEEAATAELDPGTWCINRFVTYETGGADWVGMEATEFCGQNAATFVLVKLYAIESSGEFTSTGSAQWETELFDSGITLRAAGNFMGDEQPELYINSSIRGVVGDRLEELDSTPDGLRGDFDGDGIIDHAYEQLGTRRIEVELGGLSQLERGPLLEWDVVDLPDLLLSLDHDGDGDDDMVALQQDGIVVGGEIGSCR
ncbi:MAG: hypothetical protein AB1Z98_25215 [Nannocystaceae bacterium]